MRMIRFMERGGEDVKRFDEAMKRAKSGIMEVCEIWEDMKSQFSERDGSYSERWTPSEDGMQYRRDGMYGRGWDDMYERRGRDSMGRFR